MKILIPIDGSQYSQATLAWATRFFDKGQHEFYLLHVVYYTPEAFVSDLELEEATKLLENARVFMEQKGFTVAEAKYVLGTPSDTICKYADEMGIDQIVMGSHGRTGLARLVMGSVSEGVFRQAKQPVLVLNTGPTSSFFIRESKTAQTAQGSKD